MSHMRVRSGLVTHLCTLVLGLCAASLSGQERLPVGVAKIDVTPQTPVLLAGYGGRTEEHTGIDTPLWARALVIGQTRPVAIVVLDNCGVPAELRDRLQERLQDVIPHGHLMVAATHTHNAPTLVGYAEIVWAGRTTAAQRKRVAVYTEWVCDRVERVVRDALRNRKPMQLAWTRGRVTFGGNRRVLRDGRWTGFGWEQAGPVDHGLPVLVARDGGGTVRAVWANYACHCTTVGSRNRVGGDWAGFANQAIEQRFKQAVSVMTIGCGADIGPQPSGNLAMARQHGQSVATEVARLVEQATWRALQRPPQVLQRTLALPLAAVPDRAHWEAQRAATRGFDRQLAISMLRRLESGPLPNAIDYKVWAWTFGEDLAMVFLGGEVVVDFAVRLNQELDWSRLWVTAWANAMPGYIPSRRVLLEGGYEADFSQVYYDQPARYALEVEDVLVRGVKSLLGPRFASPPDQALPPFHRPPSGETGALEGLARRVAGATGEWREIVNWLQVNHKHAALGVERIEPGDAETTRWHNFAGDFTARHFIRQQSPDARLAWRLPRTDADVPVYCFTGGLGWESEPKTDGFTMTVGKSRLEFDVTRSPARWKSRDGVWTLVYLPLWTSTVDSGGFFFLRASRRVDTPSRVVVRSLGKGSKRWFALDSEQEIKRLLPLLGAALTP